MTCGDSAGDKLKINPYRIAIGGDSAGGKLRMNPDRIAIGRESARCKQTQS